MKNKIKKYIFNILSCFVILIIIIEISLLFQRIILHKEYGEIFGLTIFTVKSGSMQPTLQIGDDILVNITKEINVGDIIVYKDNKDDIYIAHRVVQVGNDKIIAKGDSNNLEDLPIKKDTIIGKTLMIFPKLGTIQGFIKKPYIFIPVVSLILIYTAYFNIYIKYKNKN